MKNKKIKNVVVYFCMLIAILGVAAAYEFSKLGGKKNDVDFSTCGILKENCIDDNCNMHYLCNDGEIKSCRIYDCGVNYGIETTNGNGYVEKLYREKFDKEKAELNVKKCAGRLAVIEKKECDNEKATAKIKLTLGSDCAISGFTMNIDGKPAMAVFKKEADRYALSANKCGAISDIVAIGEGGVQIKEYY